MLPTMMTYIEKEPEALKRVLDAYPKPEDEALKGAPLGTQDWLILGTGSSINAIRSAKLYMEKIANVRIQVEEPYNYAQYETVSKTTDFVIGVSQSGQSTATIDAIAKVAKQRSIFRMAVTSQPGKELSQASDTTLDILTGKERVGYVTMGYNATVLSLMLVALRYAKANKQITKAEETAELEQLAQVIAKVPDAIKATDAFYQAHAKALKDPRQYSAIGYGATVGTVMEMQTKFVEVVRQPAGGHDLEAFMHGPYLGIHKDDIQFYVQTKADTSVRTKMSALRDYEARYIDKIYTIDLTGEPASANTLALGEIEDQFMSSLVAVIAFQVLAWRITCANGVDLGKQIFTDFSEVVHNKTEVQDYV
ncbi:SIS domain-containing protein [Lacticaseibacillus porcinae]|uniref:SIS domain-containing protein n=1 Tax=Lacticaseibacillus porcinae TaxID=1123687 RepID=UPI000F788395|nr:SIS domain-containing protein [Lacticaseibacillus porcinae]